MNREKRITRKQLKVSSSFRGKGGITETRAVILMWHLFLDAIVQPK